MTPHLTTLFAYDDWANRETLVSLERVQDPPPRSIEIMGHMVGCQWLWLGRLEGAAQPAVVWPQLTVAQCADQLGELANEWTRYLEGMTPSSPTKDITYVNSKGEPWHSSVQDILFHVIMHSGYHRGQIAMLLGRAGHEPAYTDFIHCIRQGKIDST